MPIAEATTARLRYRLEGPARAPVVVLAASLGTTLELWDAQAEAISRRYRVLRYDHRGHGGSATLPGPYTIELLGRDLVQLLDALDLGRVSICGLSLGGMVAMWAAIESPERVDRLVLCCTSAHLGPPNAWTERAATARGAGTRAIREEVLRRWFTPNFASRRPSEVERFGEMLAGISDEGYAACCEAIRDMDLRGDLERIGSPTLLVAGAEDAAIPPDHAWTIASGISGTRIRVLPDAAHLVNVEQVGAFTSAVLDQLDGGRSGAHKVHGMAVRRAVLGDDHVNAATAGTAPFSAAFQDLITRYVWGEIWGRPSLDRGRRSLVTLSMLLGLGRDEELALHLGAARRNGVTLEEIEEVFLHAAIYCGVPAANRAFAIAREALGPDSTR